jgi:hypothetical protein
MERQEPVGDRSKREPTPTEVKDATKICSKQHRPEDAWLAELPTSDGHSDPKGRL